MLSHNKTKWRARAAFTLLGVNILCIGLFWWGTSGSLAEAGRSNLAIAVGRLFGFLAQLAILLELVLIGRITWLEQTFGHDKMNIVHRWVGYSIILTFIGHVGFLVGGYSSRSGRTAAEQFQIFAQNYQGVSMAILGTFLFVLVIAISIAIVRKRLRYETWYSVHLLTYLAIFLVFGHQLAPAHVNQSPYVAYWLVLNGAVFGLVLAYRFVRPLWLFNRHRFVVSKVMSETTDVVSIYITGRNIEKFKFQAGQFANWTFLGRGLWWTHPFSFSQSYNGKELRITIKALGDFTQKVQSIKPGTKVIVDGPLGGFTLQKAVTDKFLFIAGGIGITPIHALLQELPQNNDAVLLYGNKTEADIVFGNELQQLTHNMTHFLSGVTDSIAKPHMHTGYITQEQLSAFVPDITQRDIYLCGPPVMMQLITKALHTLGVPKSQIHFEKFSY